MTVENFLYRRFSKQKIEWSNVLPQAAKGGKIYHLVTVQPVDVHLTAEHCHRDYDRTVNQDSKRVECLGDVLAWKIVATGNCDRLLGMVVIRSQWDDEDDECCSLI